MKGCCAMTEQMMDPNKTMLVIKHDGKQVGKIPATSKKAEVYINDLASVYGNLEIDYVPDENAGLLAEIF